MIENWENDVYREMNSIVCVLRVKHEVGAAMSATCEALCSVC